MKKQSPPREFMDQVAALPIEVLDCRDSRHWRRPRPFYKVEVEGGARGAVYLEREIVCERCGKAGWLELYRVFPDRLERLESRPKYEKGYLLHGVPKGIKTVDVCRYERARRAGLVE